MFAFLSCLGISAKHRRRVGHHRYIIPDKNEWTEYETKECLDAIKTVLFKKGRVMTEINNISDAILHSRSGAGGDLPAGPGLYKELSDFDSYKEVYGPKGSLYRHLVSQLEQAQNDNDEGIIANPEGMNYLCNSITLGHYRWFTEYSIPYKCKNVKGIRTCTAEGDVFSHGFDKWDFDNEARWDFISFMIHEKIPEWLVKLHGKNMKEFNTHYSKTDHFKLTVKINE